MQDSITPRSNDIVVAILM